MFAGHYIYDCLRIQEEKKYHECFRREEMTFLLMHFISNLGFYFSLLSSSHATPSPTPLLKLFPEHVFERERLELVPVALVELVLVLHPVQA